MRLAVPSQGDQAATVEKSYSPISPAGAVGHFDLLVKAYPARVAHVPLPSTHGKHGGLGAALCSLRIGECVDMKVKPAQSIQGSPYTRNRWDHLLLVANGTGIAPLFQLMRTVLEDPEDRTFVSLVYANRTEHDILLRSDIEQLRAARGAGVFVRHVLSQPPPGWDGGRGRVAAADIRAAIAAHCGPNRMVIVCGKDEFIGTVCGQMERVTVAGQKANKLQGPLKGILAELGFRSSEVHKL